MNETTLKAACDVLKAGVENDPPDEQPDTDGAARDMMQAVARQMRQNEPSSRSRVRVDDIDDLIAVLADTNTAIDTRLRLLAKRIETLEKNVL